MKLRNLGFNSGYTIYMGKINKVVKGTIANQTELEIELGKLGVLKLIKVLKNNLRKNH